MRVCVIIVSMESIQCIVSSSKSIFPKAVLLASHGAFPTVFMNSPFLTPHCCVPCFFTF